MINFKSLHWTEKRFDFTPLTNILQTNSANTVKKQGDAMWEDGEKYEWEDKEPEPQKTDQGAHQVCAELYVSV